MYDFITCINFPIEYQEIKYIRYHRTSKITFVISNSFQVQLLAVLYVFILCYSRAIVASFASFMLYYKIMMHRCLLLPVQTSITAYHFWWVKQLYKDYKNTVWQLLLTFRNHFKSRYKSFTCKYFCLVKFWNVYKNHWIRLLSYKTFKTLLNCDIYQ